MVMIKLDVGRLLSIILRGRVGRQTVISANTLVCLSTSKLMRAEGGSSPPPVSVGGQGHTSRSSTREVILIPDIAATNGNVTPSFTSQSSRGTFAG